VLKLWAIFILFEEKNSFLNLVEMVEMKLCSCLKSPSCHIKELGLPSYRHQGFINRLLTRCISLAAE
jgi:hypothetical protein